MNNPRPHWQSSEPFQLAERQASSAPANRCLSRLILRGPPRLCINLFCINLFCINLFLAERKPGIAPFWTSREFKPMDDATLIVSNEFSEVINSAIARRQKHLWLVGGRQLASSLLSRRLINQLTITEMPIKLGSGIPLFARHQIAERVSGSVAWVEKHGFRQVNNSRQRRPAFGSG